VYAYSEVPGGRSFLKLPSRAGEIAGRLKKLQTGRGRDGQNVVDLAWNKDDEEDCQDLSEKISEYEEIKTLMWASGPPM
jgi:hypothetical protein